jgi:hypothetical protein
LVFDKYLPNGITFPRNVSINSSTFLQTHCRLWFHFYERIQAPNIRFDATVLDRNCKSSLKPHTLVIFHTLLIFLRNFPEHLNVTTLRGLSIIESPVAGFLPFRSFLSFTQNLPNPLTRTSSPDARVDLMVSMSCSTTSLLFFWGNPSCWWTDSMMSALVSAILSVPLKVGWLEFVDFVNNNGNLNGFYGKFKVRTQSD